MSDGSPLPPCPIGPQVLQEDRDARGRFAPGNPGKQPGTKRRTTLRVEELLEGDVEQVTRAVLAAAKGGDMIAAKIILDRVAPIRRGRPIHIPNFPVVRQISDIPTAHSALVTAVANGDVSAEEAAPMSALLAALGNSLDQAALAARLDELERRIEERRRPGQHLSSEEMKGAEQAYTATLNDDGPQ